jgi:hypothetical protein
MMILLNSRETIDMWQTITESIARQHEARKRTVLLEKERRRMERLRKVVTIACRNVERNEEFTVVTENINILGVKFTTSKKPVEGDVLSLRLLLFPGMKNVEALGRIVWCREREINNLSFYEGGMEFAGMTKENRRLLENFLGYGSVS